MPKITASNQTAMAMDGMILQHLRIRNLHTRVWLDIAPRLAVNILLGTSFIDRCILKTFPAERMLMPKLATSRNSNAQSTKKEEIKHEKVYYGNPNDEHNRDKADQSFVRIV